MLSLKAYAKINLGLSVLEKREDGYHNIEGIFQKIALFDELHIERTREGIFFETNSPPYGKENICHRVIDRFFEIAGCEGGVRVNLKKNIWTGAGLGGASSDAATLLKGLNEIYGNPLNKQSLFEIARGLGSDVPFFLDGSLVLVKGRGDELFPLHLSLPIHFVLVYPGFPIMTEWAYRALNGKSRTRRGNIKTLLGFLKKGDIDNFASNLFNDFEEVVFGVYPDLGEIKEKLLNYGCIGASLSGSGSVVYGVLRKEEEEKKWKECIGLSDVRVVGCQVSDVRC